MLFDRSTRDDLAVSPELAEAIMEEIRACRSTESVSEVARKYASALNMMDRDPELCVRAIHIRNLGTYQRRMILEGHVS